MDLKKFNKVNPNKKDKTAPSVEYLPDSPFPVSLHKKDYFLWFARNFFYEMAITHEEHDKLIEEHDKIIKDLSLLHKSVEEQNQLLRLQNKLIVNLLEDDNEIIIPQIIYCPECNNKFYSTNKSYFENQKCPHCSTQLNEEIKPLRIKRTAKIEEGICPYCEGNIHTNDLICPICYKKLTPIYDELLEEKLRKEKEKLEKDEKFLRDNEEEIFEYYRKARMNKNYSKENAMKDIIFKYGISNTDALERLWESEVWIKRFKDIDHKNQADNFLKKNDNKFYEDYMDLIVNESYSEKDAKEEILKKHNITDPYIIEKINDENLIVWNSKIKNERLEQEKLEKEKLERERLKKERMEKDRLEQEKLKKERLEKLRLEKEKSKNSKQCSKCGVENELDNNFCINCGNKL